MNSHTNDRFDDDQIYEEESDLIGSALKVNIKNDPASVRSRPRLVPIWKLNVDSENLIPEMPKDVLPKPDDKHYEKTIKELKDKIEHHRKSLEELKKKIRNERFGSTPQIKEALQEKESTFEKLKGINSKLEELRATIAGPQKELANLKAERERLTRMVTVNKIEHLLAEIKSIQERLGFASLSISEEKKLIERKNKLEGEKENVQRLSEVQKKIKEIHEKYKPTFDKISELNKEKGPYQEKLLSAKGKLQKLKSQAEENDPVIKNLELQVENIKKNMTENREQINTLNKEWNDKWYHYEKQQELISYIKEANDAIAQMKKKAEKERKRKEKLEKKEAQAGNNDNQTITSTVEQLGKYDHEIWSCEWLGDYFKKFLGGNNIQSAGTSNSSSLGNNQGQSKIDEDIKKGLIKPIDRESRMNEFTISTTSAQPSGGKKGKAPKISKRELKVENSNLLNLDITIIKKIKDLNLSPPSYKNEIPSFLDKLSLTLESFRCKAAGKEMPTPQIVPTVEKVTPVETKEIPETEMIQETPKTTITETIKAQPEKKEEVHVPVETKQHESPAKVRSAKKPSPLEEVEEIHEAKHQAVEEVKPVETPKVEEIVQEVEVPTTSTVTATVDVPVEETKPEKTEEPKQPETTFENVAPVITSTPVADLVVEKEPEAEVSKPEEKNEEIAETQKDEDDTENKEKKHTQKVTVHVEKVTPFKTKTTTITTHHYESINPETGEKEEEEVEEIEITEEIEEEEEIEDS